MMPSNLKAAAAYRNVGLQTQAVQHDQYQLVVMMFDAVLESLNVARGALEQKDVALKIKHIDKAMRIIQEGLRTSLDLDNGGELAANLASLYDYCVMRLTQANASNNGAMLQEVGDLIRPVADAWKQLRSGTTTEPAAAAKPAQAPAAPQVPPATRRMASVYGQGFAMA